MSANLPPDGDGENPAELETVASQWLARRDRGFTAEEQDRYFEWLRGNPRHGAEIARLEKPWHALDALAEWRPVHSAQPNPDLLLRRPRQVRRWPRVRTLPLAGLALAAAAVIGLGVFEFQSVRRREAPPAAGRVRVIPPPERLSLADGSVVDLNHDGRIEIDFSPEVRRVRLLRGEAHFTVAKNPARPFVVEAKGVAVRAVGTAFDVRHTSGAVEVLVTEGTVQVERAVPPSATPLPARASTPLVAGERAVVQTAARAVAPVVEAVSASEISHTLAWQGVRLEFEALPLAEVVTEFNLRNRQQLTVGDTATGRLRVGGSFRADNVEAFVRLLDASFGVIAERRADGALVLRRTR